MVVRELVALLGIQTDEKSAKKAESMVSNLISKAKGLVAAYAGMKGIQAFKGLIFDIAEASDWLDKMSLRTGIATDTLQQLEHAAKLSGGSLAAIENSIRKLQTAQVDADSGLETYTREFKRLGVEIKDANGEFKSGEDLLLDIADGMKELTSDAERSAVAMKLMGRTGTQLIPMLKEGREPILAMTQEIKDMGATIDKDLIAAGAQFIDNQERMGRVFQSVKIAIARDFIPWSNRATSSMIEWWKANKDWLRTGIVDTLKFFGRIFRFVGETIWAAVKPVIQLWQSFSKMEKGIVGVATVITLLGLAIQKGPIGKLLMIATLIGIIIEDFQVWRDGGVSVIGTLVEKMSEFLGIDVESEVKKWSGLFVEMGQSITETILTMAGFIIGVFQNGIGPAWEELIFRLSGIWEQWGIDIQGTITRVANFYKDTWQGVVDWIFDNVIQPINRFFNTGALGKISSFFGGKGAQALADINARGGVGKVAAGGVAGGLRGEFRPALSGSVNQSLQMNNTINAAPGMSEGQIGDMVASRVKDAMTKQNRDALKAFVPKVGTAGV
jgi:hypothetical protein